MMVAIRMLVMGVLLTGFGPLAQGSGSVPSGAVASATCQDAKVFQTMFSRICWECIFPIKVAGQPIGPGSMPSGAVRDPLCMCDPPFPGITMGAWFPVRMIETVKMPNCSPTFGGVKLSFGSDSELGGDLGKAGTHGSADATFRHVHYFAFPVGEVLGLISGCNPLDSFDLLKPTELLPTWNDDLLAFFVNPETAVFANPAGVASCMVEAGITGVAGGPPMDALYWCAGSWGSLYPLTGNINYQSSPPADTSLMGARLITQLHRWGLARKTMGNSCGGDIAVTIPKTQYRMQQYYPESMASMPGGDQTRGNHWIGESDFRWGVHKNWPMKEDYLHLVFRWNDCCLEL